jgi:hypothetical protein
MFSWRDNKCGGYVRLRSRKWSRQSKSSSDSVGRLLWIFWYSRFSSPSCIVPVDDALQDLALTLGPLLERCLAVLLTSGSRSLPSFSLVWRCSTLRCCLGRLELLHCWLPDSFVTLSTAIVTEFADVRRWLEGIPTNEKKCNWTACFPTLHRERCHGLFCRIGWFPILVCDMNAYSML